MSTEPTPTDPEIEALARQLGAIDAGNKAEAIGGVEAPAVDGQPAQVEVTPEQRAEEVAAVLGLLVEAGAPMLPYLPVCYPPRTRLGIAHAIVAVAEKHGWDLDAAMSPEVALLLALLPGTARAFGEHRNMKRQRALQAVQPADLQDRPEPAPAPAPAPDNAPANDGRVT